MVRGRGVWAGAWAGGLAIAAHAVAVGLIAPGLTGLWVSRDVARAVQSTGLDPRGALVAGPIAVAGYAEPSLVFLLGTPVRLTDASGALQALREGRPAVVGPAEEATIRAALPDLAPAAARIQGLNYSDGRARDLRILRPPPVAQPIGPPAPTPPLLSVPTPSVAP